MTDEEYLKKYLDPSEYEEGIKKLKQNIPVQYIVGNVDFYGNLFEVNENVLIPRFETEELVFKTIKRIEKKFDKKIDIIDLGTGSGCIAITLAKHLNSQVDAIDISDKALEIAKINNINNKTNVNFILGDIKKPLNKKYDVIISNPPYISYNEEIMDIVKNNEPHIALYASNNGLEFYEKILKNIKNSLKEEFLIAFEIGYKQGQDIILLANKYLKNINISLEKDMQGKDRFVFIENKWLIIIKSIDKHIIMIYNHWEMKRKEEVSTSHLRKWIPG